MATKQSDHIANAIKSTDVNTSPYEWMHIKNLFTDDYFKINPT